MKVRTQTEPLKTVLVITLGFLVLHWLTGYKWSFYTATCIALLGVISSRMAFYIDWVWMKLAFILGLIIPNILLSLIFFLFVTPIAFLSRIFGEKDPIQLRKTDSSTYKVRNVTFKSESFEKPW